MKRIVYFLLTLNGVALVIATLYMQWISMDLSRYSVAEYETDLRQWLWWTAIGFPFLVGWAYLGAAAFGVWMNFDNKKTLILLTSCFVFGCLLSVVSGLGYVAAVSTAICLAYASSRHRLGI